MLVGLKLEIETCDGRRFWGKGVAGLFFTTWGVADTRGDGRRPLSLEAGARVAAAAAGVAVAVALGGYFGIALGSCSRAPMFRAVVLNCSGAPIAPVLWGTGAEAHKYSTVPDFCWSTKRVSQQGQHFLELPKPCPTQFGEDPQSYKEMGPPPSINAH